MQQRGANFEDANGSRLISSFKGVVSCTLKIYRYSIYTPYLDQLIYLGVRGYQDSSKVLYPASLESFPMRQSLLLCTRNASRHCARLNNRICVQNTNYIAIFPMTLISMNINESWIGRHNLGHCPVTYEDLFFIRQCPIMGEILLLGIFNILSNN